jgi:hypothetical protein
MIIDVRELFPLDIYEPLCMSFATLLGDLFKLQKVIIDQF